MEKIFEVVFEMVGDYLYPTILAAQNFHMAEMIADTMIGIGHRPFGTAIRDIHKIEKMTAAYLLDDDNPALHWGALPTDEGWKRILEKIGYHLYEVDFVQLHHPDRIIGFVPKIDLRSPASLNSVPV